MKDKVFRVCRRCGKEWNVSRLDPGEKVYVCPICETRERLKAREVRDHTTRQVMDPGPAAGGAAGQGSAVPAAPAAAGGPAQRPAGKE